MDKWHSLYPPLCLGMLEKFPNARFGVLILFCFTRPGKSKRQGDGLDPALFLLEILPTETHCLHPGTLKIIQNACVGSGCKRKGMPALYEAACSASVLFLTVYFHN